MKITKTKYRAQGLAALRERLCLNQKLMAMYLNINVNTLKQIETGRRALPTQALITIGRLEILQAANNKDNCYQTAHPAERYGTYALRQKLDLLIIAENKCRDEEDILTTQLNTMKTAYHIQRTRLQVIESIIEEEKIAQAVQHWQLQKDIVIDALNKCSIPLQLLVQTEIHILKSKIGAYNKLRQQLITDFPELYQKQQLIS